MCQQRAKCHSAGQTGAAAAINRVDVVQEPARGQLELELKTEIEREEAAVASGQTKGHNHN